MDDLSLVVCGHGAAVLPGVLRVGGEDLQVVAPAGVLQPVLAAGLREENKLMPGKL